MGDTQAQSNILYVLLTAVVMPGITVLVQEMWKLRNAKRAERLQDDDRVNQRDDRTIKRWQDYAAKADEEHEKTKKELSDFKKQYAADMGAVVAKERRCGETVARMEQWIALAQDAMHREGIEFPHYLPDGSAPHTPLPDAPEGGR
jgi:hypothetical protein